MSEKQVRRRAPGMSPEERRAMIVAAALPLVAEYGTAVTTSQIARAAGIGEATIFRVFADKDELLDACMIEAMRPDHAVTEIASIPLDQPLAERLAEAADALSAHLARMGTVAGVLHSTGHRRGEPGVRPQPQPGSREASMQLIGDAIADLLEPDEASLRLPAETVGKVFLGLLFARPAVLSTSELVEVFLHGAVKEEPA
ncbi:TetR/AcrR family transcriptional regulator [Nonomuraea guangzhouensis]|uniref:TetR/AcrR family transcriptional regulator n=1 Tax=Nonomuraea guangzhouensis TaxID=1291555 RepID=A0ABW4GWG3_9ACTN|nr:TetR/AcrR family transcriptional regulator [Nonomuraea guangzhouensis]